jgi:hypothetical protein
LGARTCRLLGVGGRHLLRSERPAAVHDQSRQGEERDGQHRQECGDGSVLATVTGQPSAR